MVWGNANVSNAIVLDKFLKLSTVLVKHDSLSLTNTSGKPRTEKIEVKCLIVAAEVADVTILASIHLECVSIRIMYIFPNKGPA